MRRAAFEQVGGFYEGVRAAEDTDFSWRLQRAGWRLELRPEASVEHQYRATLRELAGPVARLRRRARVASPPLSRLRARAGGAAWVAAGVGTRAPEWERRGHARRPPAAGPAFPPDTVGRLDRGRYLALDALLAVDELAGFMLSNRPERGALATAARWSWSPTDSPSRGDPLVDFAGR